MLQKSKFIVVTICKDNIEQLSKTLESVQTFMPAAFSLVIDSSKDSKSMKELASSKRPYKLLKFIFTPPRGIYNAMNISFEFLDDFDYVMWLNSGDNLISKIDFLDKIKNKLIIGQVKIIENNFYTGKLYPPTFFITSLNRFIFYTYFFSYNHQAAIFPTNILNNIKYRKDLKIYSDLAFKQKVLRKAIKNNYLKIINSPIVAFSAGGLSQLDSFEKFNISFKELNLLLLKREISFFIYLPKILLLLVRIIKLFIDLLLKNIIK